jgi:hypothetical protein
LATSAPSRTRRSKRRRTRRRGTTCRAART